MESLHPVAIHLPLVLVFLWPVVDGLGLRLRSPHLQRLGLALLALAAVSSLFATATGQAAFDVAVAQGTDPALLRTHTDNADLMPWIFMVLTALRAWLPSKWGARGHAAAVALGVCVVPLAFVVGQSGGKLVYQHGVGVQAGQPPVAGQAPKR